jgi:hypothetical protein
MNGSGIVNATKLLLQQQVMPRIIGLPHRLK